MINTGMDPTQTREIMQEKLNTILKICVYVRGLGSVIIVFTIAYCFKKQSLMQR